MKVERKVFLDLLIAGCDEGVVQSVKVAGMPFHTAFDGKLVISMAQEMGNVSMQAHVTRALQLIAPKECILVGIAGTLDRKNAPVGSLVVPTAIHKWDFFGIEDGSDEFQKAAKEENKRLIDEDKIGSAVGVVFHYRSLPDKATNRDMTTHFVNCLENAERQLKESVQHDINCVGDLKRALEAFILDEKLNEMDAHDVKAAFERLPDALTTVHDRNTMIAGDSVVKAKAMLLSIRRAGKDGCAAVAMEDYGFLAALEVAGARGFVVRAITDDGTKNKKFFDMVR